MRFPTSALVVAVMLTRATASSAEIAAERNDRGGLRKGNRRRKLQNRSIICEAQGTSYMYLSVLSFQFSNTSCVATFIFLKMMNTNSLKIVLATYFLVSSAIPPTNITGGVGQSGLVPTAPSYTDCYLNGCASTYSCTDSSQCAPESCCMPTSWVFYGNYCVSVAQLDNLNQFARRKCLCREAERTSAGNAGDTIISGGQVTILGGEEAEEDAQQDSTNTNAHTSGGDSETVQQQQQQQTEGSTIGSTSSNVNTSAQQQQTTTATTTTACNGCMFDGKCVPTGVAWMRRDGCTRCYCNKSGDYRCIDSSCPTTATTTATTITTTTANKPTQENISQGQVEPAKEVTPTPPKTQPTTDLNPSAPQSQTNNEQQEPNNESEQTKNENNTQSPAGQASDNTPTTDSNLPSANPQSQPEIPSSPQPPKCTGCTVNGLCLPTGAQWVLTEGSCNRRCVCFNKDQSGEYRCAPCPQSFAASTPAVSVTELNNNNNNNDAQEEGDGGTASTSAESSRVVPGFGTVGEDDGGGLFSEEDIINAEFGYPQPTVAPAMNENIIL